MKISFVVWGDPKPKRRHRSFFNKKIGCIMQYADPKGVKEEEDIRLQAIKHKPPMPFLCPIHLMIYFYMPIPKSTSKKKKREMLERTIQHIKRPDLDNLLKKILDALRGVMWRDDAQIYKIETTKCYADNPRTEITILEQ